MIPQIHILSFTLDEKLHCLSIETSLCFAPTSQTGYSSKRNHPFPHSKKCHGPAIESFTTEYTMISMVWPACARIYVDIFYFSSLSWGHWDAHETRGRENLAHVASERAVIRFFLFKITKKSPQTLGLRRKYTRLSSMPRSQRGILSSMKRSHSHAHAHTHTHACTHARMYHVAISGRNRDYISIVVAFSLSRADGSIQIVILCRVSDTHDVTHSGSWDFRLL